MAGFQRRRVYIDGHAK